MSFSTSNFNIKDIVHAWRRFLAPCMLACCSAIEAHAARLVTLTPHATEMVYAAGAGKQIVATVQSSDYPAAALNIPRVGDGITTAVEQIIRWKPDWVIGWPSPLMEKLQELGIKTWITNPNSLDSIAAQVLAMAKTFGDVEKARHWSLQYQRLLAAAKQQTDPGRPIRVAVLASADGQFVIARHALINEALHHCGGLNVFGQLASPAIRIGPESLIAAKPDVIISGEPLMNKPASPAPIVLIEGDWLYRPGPRFALAAEQLCKIIAASTPLVR